MANNNNNTMGQFVVMTRADLDALLQDAIAASRSLMPEPAKEEVLPSMADEYVTRQQAAKILHLDVSSFWRLESPRLEYDLTFVSFFFVSLTCFLPWVER